MSRFRALSAALLPCLLSPSLALAESTLAGTAAASTWDRSTLRDIAEDISRQHGLDPRLIDSVIRVESNYNPRAVSHKGAQGLMQLMPATAARLDVDDPFDPEQNIRGGVREVARLIDLYSGNLALVLAAYNAGQGAVERYQGIPPYNETQNYVRQVMSLYTGSPWSSTRVTRRPQVKMVTDPATGRTVITNQTLGRIGTAPAGLAAVNGALAGGFGR